MAGFVSAEGSFMVKKRKSASVKTGFQVVVCFRISQHTRDLMLIKSFERYLGCGLIAKWNSRTEAVFQVEKFSDITAKIIPLFHQYPILGIKSQDFDDFCKVFVPLSFDWLPPSLSSLSEDREGGGSREGEG